MNQLDREALAEIDAALAVIERDAPTVINYVMGQTSGSIAGRIHKVRDDLKRIAAGEYVPDPAEQPEDEAQAALA